MHMALLWFVWSFVGSSGVPILIMYWADIDAALGEVTLRGNVQGPSGTFCVTMGTRNDYVYIGLYCIHSTYMDFLHVVIKQWYH